MNLILALWVTCLALAVLSSGFIVVLLKSRKEAQRNRVLLSKLQEASDRMNHAEVIRKRFTRRY